MFDDQAFNAHPGQPGSFPLNSHGEGIYLFSAAPDGGLTGYAHGFEFGAAANGVSFGRHMISTGEERFPAQRANSQGWANGDARVGPVVIGEIMPYIDVDVVEYADNAPWPAEADGGGPSLERRVLSAYGDDPANWRCSADGHGSPGAASAQDSDADDLPDDWEHRFFGGVDGPGADRWTDPDGDGMTTWEEFLCGTDPTNAASVLWLSIAASAGVPVVGFATVTADGAGYEGSARFYRLESCGRLDSLDWATAPGQERVPGTGARVERAETRDGSGFVYRARAWQEWPSP